MIKAGDGSIRPEHNILSSTLCPFLSSYGLPSVVSPQPWRERCRDEYSVHLCGSGEGRHAHATICVWRSEDSRVWTCLGPCLSVVYCCLGRLADLWHLEISPVSVPDLTANSYQCPWFYISPGPSKSGIHVYTANSWPSEPCFHPREVFWVRFQFIYTRSTPLDQCVNLAGYLCPPAVWQAGRVVCVLIWVD